MVDTNFALRATLPIPGGAARKLWVIFAYGAASYRAEHLALDLDELDSERLQHGGVVHPANDQRSAAQDEVAKFEELLPIDTPNDWVLAGSAACWDEYQRKALEISSRFGRKLDAEMAAKLMRRYQSICVLAPKPAYAVNVPLLTSDPDDDLLVFDSLRTGVDIFISDDPHVVPDGDDGCKEYEFGDKRLRAMRSAHFFEHCCDDIEWNEIDGSWI